MSHTGVTAGLAISGVYDLAPIRDSYLNEALRISDYTRPLAALKLKASIVVLDAARANSFAKSGQPLAGGGNLRSSTGRNCAPSSNVREVTSDQARILSLGCSGGELDAFQLRGPQSGNVRVHSR